MELPHSTITLKDTCEEWQSPPISPLTVAEQGLLDATGRYFQDIEDIQDHGFVQLTAEMKMKEKIIQDDGRKLAFYNLSDEDASKVTDDHLIQLIKEDVKAEELAYIISRCL